MRVSFLTTVSLVSAFLAFAPPVFAIYKCQSKGTIVYSDAPCDNGKTTAGTMQEIPIQSAPTEEGEAARKQLAKDKQQLERLVTRRNKTEAADERGRQKARKASESTKKKCEELALRRRWAEEDAASAGPKALERARQNARRAAERHQLHCGN